MEHRKTIVIDGRFLDSEDLSAIITAEISGGPQHPMMVIDRNLTKDYAIRSCCDQRFGTPVGEIRKGVDKDRKIYIDPDEGTGAF